MAATTDRLRNFGFLVRDVYRLYAKHFERYAREIELTLAQCKVLGHLSRNEGISQTRLAELTDTDPMTLVRTLDRMQQDQWIERRADPEDRRAHRLYLRQAGGAAHVEDRRSGAPGRAVGTECHRARTTAEPARTRARRAVATRAQMSARHGRQSR